MYRISDSDVIDMVYTFIPYFGYILATWFEDLDGHVFIDEFLTIFVRPDAMLHFGPSVTPATYQLKPCQNLKKLSNLVDTVIQYRF